MCVCVCVCVCLCVVYFMYNILCIIQCIDASMIAGCTCIVYMWYVYSTIQKLCFAAQISFFSVSHFNKANQDS